MKNGKRISLDASAERDAYTDPADMKKHPTAAEIEAWLIAQISGRSGRTPDNIDIRKPFVYHGLNSKQVVSMTGVFIGISGSDYGRLLFEGPARLDLYSGTGSSTSIAAHRVSYKELLW